MNRSLVRILLFTGLLTALTRADETAGWPRQYALDQHEVVMFQPQIEEWNDFKQLSARVAVKVTPAGSSTNYFGAMQLDAETITNHEQRRVLLQNGSITELSFPNVDPITATLCDSVVRAVLDPENKPIDLPLEQIAANLQRTQQQQQVIEVGLMPPPIFYSEHPAILLMFMGDPKFERIEGTRLFYAVNTNWDCIMDTATGSYYILNGNGWLTTLDPKKGTWLPARNLPTEFNKLPDDGNWTEVKKQIPGVPPTYAPRVFYSNEPAELIVTAGKPTFAPCPDTRLLYITNTGYDVFLHTVSQRYYFLTAGRWFSAPSLQGPWISAQDALPVEFSSIPPDGPKGSVLTSISGTPQAQAALLLASVPQKATIQRSEVSVTVAYDGAPDFVSIPSTTVSYAVNTPNSVFFVNNRYYCCYQSVWFESSSATGTWIVSSTIPQAIYTIPATHPMHNVTYVYIYDSTPDTVIVGCTAGYHGAYIARGLVLFGLGYAWGHHDGHHHHDHHYHHGPHYYSYGCGARYDHHRGVYYRGAVAYGPYGGAGRVAVYNPRTGGYARGAVRYGPRGSAFAREAYNPFTERYSARAGVKTPYGSWGRSVVSDGDKWARAGHRANDDRITAGFGNSDGKKALATYNRNTGTGHVIRKNKDGDVYVGRDGNIYKKENGSWQKRNGNEWKSFDPPKKIGSPVKNKPVSIQPVKDRSFNKPVTTQPVKKPLDRIQSSRPSTTTTRTLKKTTTRPSSSQTLNQLKRASQTRSSANTIFKSRSSSSRSIKSSISKPSLKRR